jgi:SAM-dependent methyltransferase
MPTGESQEATTLDRKRRDRAEGLSDQAGALGDPPREVYTHGYTPQVAAYMAARTATREAEFLLPHLRVGMRLLDCGCGPGSTTLGLAAAIAPGQAEGIDIEPSHIAAAPPYRPLVVGAAGHTRRMTIIGLHHAGVHVAGLERSIAFSQAAFGAQSLDFAEKPTKLVNKCRPSM